ncbi:hypothetical protein ACHHYP_09113 [Achlya hypogyna]|uniref:RING-type domain-containing protein n=1 Tax=Achlya hypogyna TaxID=1202772 RepID=A0A1V9YNS0_ACHHY|nr:hypothetical protein ACHHYP_09113 [Achlya hypogyna]
MSSDGECIICLEPLAASLSCLPCGHVYHEKCVAMSLRTKKQCPTCRTTFQTHHMIKLFFAAPAMAAPVTRPTNDEVDAVTNIKNIQDVNREMAKQIAQLRAREERLEARHKTQLADLVQYEQRLVMGEEETARLKKATEVLKKAKVDAVYEKLLLEQTVREQRAALKKLQAKLGTQSLGATIQAFIDTNRIEVLEAELQRPHDVILALKTANKFRAAEYEKLVAKYQARDKAPKRTARQTPEDFFPSHKRPKKVHEPKAAPKPLVVVIDEESPPLRPLVSENEPPAALVTPAQVPVYQPSSLKARLANRSVQLPSTFFPQPSKPKPMSTSKKLDTRLISDWFAKS